jgi:acetyl-CoA carboxylase biotin carboxylase subunit
MFKKILVANRGEIALRVIEACREMGIPTVAVFSEVDRNSLHVHMADEAYCIGPAPARQSYLSMAAIMSTAEVSHADAIHPGYGFLAEDPHFVEVCEESKIVFIGPRFETMVQSGKKLECKKVVSAVGVPVVPGSGALKTEEDLVSEARTLGFPLIFKASAGGGGRGMRVVQDEPELLDKFHAVRREAEAAFGDPTVFLEKYIPVARHIEVQILADQHGNVVHWGERECSIQRRYQKLIEESSAPALTEELRLGIWASAVKAAKVLGYQNAGTVEFLVDGRNFYMIEINARIQVEHPISELRVGKNLIQEQIRLAAGEKLGYTQEDLAFHGHAIECRLNAEDPSRNFAPSTGSLAIQSLPGGNGVRFDSHIFSGMNVTPFYDSLLAKLIVHAEDRPTAIVKMNNALKRFQVEGVKTTAPLCHEILQHPDFVNGDFNTQFLEKHLPMESGSYRP